VFQILRKYEIQNIPPFAGPYFQHPTKKLVESSGVAILLIDLKGKIAFLTDRKPRI